MADTMDKLLNGAGLVELWGILEDKYGIYKQHWWKKSLVAEGGYSESLVDHSYGDLLLMPDEHSTFRYSKSVSVNQTTGEVSLVDPQTFSTDSDTWIAVDADYDYATSYDDAYASVRAVTQEIAALRPCYIEIPSGRTGAGIYFLPANASGGSTSSTVQISYEEHYIEEDEYYPEYVPYTQWEFEIRLDSSVKKASSVYVTSDSGEIFYLRSADRNAYPDNDVVDGWQFEYMGVPFDNLPTALRMRKLSYVGTGTYGSANPNTVTFEFKPMLVYLKTPSNGAGAYCWWGYGEPGSFYTDGYPLVFTWTGNTLSWYASRENSSAGHQANANNVIYEVYYIG